VTVYADTSSLVKLFVEEAESDAVRERILTASVVFTSDVVYAEVRAALARRRRDGTLFETKWTDLLSIPATQEICHEAGDLAERYELRGFDSIHLASFAEMLRGLQGRDQVEFSSFDEHLNGVAKRVARTIR
jgi:predicted nucleic acid-binding protein